MGFNIWQLRFEMDQWPEEKGQTTVHKKVGSVEINLPYDHPALVEY